MCAGSSSKISEAFLFFYSEAQLWLDTENALEWLEVFAFSNDLGEYMSVNMTVNCITVC
jgi:hypothetical protein